ncbi:MAG: S8 family peptidase [Geminicoccaceae bacterium]
MRRAGHIMLKLEDGIETRAPVHIDVLDGARRPGGSIDGRGPVDRTILAQTTGLRAKRCFHAGACLHKVGARHLAYDEVESALGLERILSVQLAEPALADLVVAELRALDQVEWAMVEPLMRAPLMLLDEAAPARAGRLATDAAFERVGASVALAMEPGARSVPVAVIDTGVALEHAEFAGRLRIGYDTVDLGMGSVAEGVALIGDSLGRDFCARDETGHGSHVSGIIAAAGLSMPRGVGGLSPIIPIRALAAAQAEPGVLFGVGGLSDIDAAIKVAVDMGAKVLNMSFGTSKDEIDEEAPPPHSAALAYAIAHNCIPVAAMGNSGLDEDYYPAALPECIAVGSMSLDGGLSSFSTTCAHVALCAPGENVLSAALDGYRESTGTSHAAPFVAGAAALLAAKAARFGHDLTMQEAHHALTAGAEPAWDGPNDRTGAGMLNIPNALLVLERMMTDQEVT